MFSRSVVFKRCISNASTKEGVEAFKTKLNVIKEQSKPYIKKMGENLNTAKTKSIAGIWSLSNWANEYINKTTGYDQITAIENQVNEKERIFETTTKQLRELNIDYLNHQKRVVELQQERSELLMKPKRTAEENKRLAELVANENDWEMPLENVQKEYLDLFELQKKQLEEYKEAIYKRYYEERAWEQKIRRLGQYSYIAMLGLNIITFGYTRYDRKRIRKNMEYTIDTNNELKDQIEGIRKNQDEIFKENQDLIMEVKTILTNAQARDEEIQAANKAKTLDQVVTAITSIKDNKEKEPVQIVVVHDDIKQKASTNVAVMSLSALATFAFLSLFL